MEKFVSIIKNKLGYFLYIKEEKANMEIFLNFPPLFYKERIEFDNPKTIDEVERKDPVYYQHFKNGGEG